ncbi:MAG: hypothetical protein K0R14_939 [Burkholderiales bacterium]|nr:hypothetical protein [Burkholderiales bacterium]
MEQYLTVKNFSKLTGVTVRTLQYYDEQDVLKPHHKSDVGYRFYSKNEMLILQKINILKYIGFNLNQIKTVLKDNKFDWLSSLNLQAKILQESIKKMQDSVMLINHSITWYKADKGEPNWEVMAKILEVLKMKQDSAYQDWIKRNFTDADLAFFGEMTATQNNEENAALWKKIFADAKSLMYLPPSDPQVQELARIVMNSANSQYEGNEGLKGKMWNLMKSGDIPEGFIPGYEKEIVLFLNQAIGIMFNSQK